MFGMYLPFLVGMLVGISPSQGGEPAAILAQQDTSTAAREPEPQTPTGKFTTALEVKPILGMTKGNWAAVRLYEDQDLVYFTHLMAWRCGLWDIRYGINGAPAEQVMAMEPCNEEYQQPNVMVDIETYPPYLIFPANSVETIYVEITFDDGTSDFAQFNRGDILIP